MILESLSYNLSQTMINILEPPMTIVEEFKLRRRRTSDRVVREQKTSGTHIAEMMSKMTEEEKDDAKDGEARIRWELR